MSQLNLFNNCIQEYENNYDRIKIASWNVNSIRARKEQVKEWLKRESPDIVCLQETKILDEYFPKQYFKDLGHNVITYGETRYNGVAILSKLEIDQVSRGFEGSSDSSARVISGRIFDMWIYNVYAPNAKSVMDKSLVKKIEWYQQFISYIKRSHNNHDQIIICGDFNVVSQDYEVFDSEHWLCSTMVDMKSRKCLSDLLDTGLVDIMRTHFPSNSLYTWRDHGDGLKVGRGMRLDYFLVSPKLVSKINSSKVDCLTREKEKSSDHAPIICEIQLK